MDSNPTASPLPPQISNRASISGNEYGWELSAFPDALRSAEGLGSPVLAVSFSSAADAVYEMYWLDADATERTVGEPWSAYCHRSCNEVGERFNALVAETAFQAEAANWVALLERTAIGSDLRNNLVFVANTTQTKRGDWREQRLHSSSRIGNALRCNLCYGDLWPANRRDRFRCTRNEEQ